MRIKILLLGDNPVSIVADAQVLRERGMMVFTAFNLQNINELIMEIKPDIIFFDAHHSNAAITDAYNEIVNGIEFTNIPVIFTLSEDDVYLVTRKRTEARDKRSFIADNMIDAIKVAFGGIRHHSKKNKDTQEKHSQGSNNNHSNKTPGSQLQIPFH